MEGTDRDSKPTLAYAGPGTPMAGPRPRNLFERGAVCLLIWLIATPFLYGGYHCWAEAAAMVPGFGEHGRLNNLGWGLVCVGGLFVCVGANALRRGGR